MIRNQHAQKLTEGKTWKDRLIWLGVSHPIQMSWTKHHLDLPLQSLQFSTPKPYRTWYHLNLHNTVADSNEFRGLSAKVALLAFWKRLNWQNQYHHAHPWEKLPQTHIWYAIFKFGKALGRNKRKWGAYLHICHHHKIWGGNMQNGHHHCVQWVKLPQIHIWDAPNWDPSLKSIWIWIQIQIQIK